MWFLFSRRAFSDFIPSLDGKRTTTLVRPFLAKNIFYTTDIPELSAISKLIHSTSQKRRMNCLQFNSVREIRRPGHYSINKTIDFLLGIVGMYNYSHTLSFLCNNGIPNFQGEKATSRESIFETVRKSHLR